MESLKNRYAKEIEWVKEKHSQYQKYLPAVFFILGFLLDILTLGEVDDLSNILTLGFYLLISIVILGLGYLKVEVKEFQSQWANRFFLYRDDIFHFLLGSLLSAFTLFYFKSSSLSNSFLFMVFMATLLVLNESGLFQKKGIVIKTSLVMLCLISYLIYLIPILFGTTGATVFFGCLMLALLLSLGGFLLLTYFNKKKEENLKELLIPHLIMTLVFLTLYILKVLPPIPLSLKYIGIAHDVVKSNGLYQTKELKRSWWDFDQVFKARPGDKVYLFANIFSPGGFEGKVYIHWLYLLNGKYQTSDKILLRINGGRAEGFRGYAFKSNYTPGDWQVRVETQEGLEIGRINFQIVTDKEVNERSFIQHDR